MPHCGGAYSCNCVVTGDGVSGSGTLSDPYVITSVPEGGGGVTDHGALTGLGDDDHTQYLTEARGDARYPLDTDPRLDDARTPTAHAATHAAAGSDPVTLTSAQISDLTETVQDIVAGTILDGGTL